jgi:hypothetical protein
MAIQTHVQCDRCKKYEPTKTEPDYTYNRSPQPPATWFELVAFGHPVVVNECYPVGPIRYLLCGDCLPQVQMVVDASVKRGCR